jgi:hypothetical protein
MTDPTIGIRAELDISDLRKQFQRMTRYFSDADKRLERHADKWNDSMRTVSNASARYEIAMAKMEKSGKSESKSNEELSERMARLAKRRAEVESQLSNVVAESTEGRSESHTEESEVVESAVDRQLTAISRLRRDIFSLIFFMRFGTRIIKSAWDTIGEASEQAQLVRGVAALSNAYGQHMGKIVSVMDDASGEVVSRFDLMRAAQAGLLADGGQFVDQYSTLWEAARVAMVTAGVDAENAFAGFLEALSQGDAAIVDQISNLYNAETAMIRYAVETGRTVEQLTLQERRHVILNEVMDTTNALLDAGAQAALDAQAPYEGLTRNVEAFKGAVGAILESGVVQGMSSQLETLAKLATITAASFAALKEMVVGLGEGEGLTADLADRMNQAFLDTFEGVATAAGFMTIPDMGAEVGDGGGGLVDALTPDPQELEDRLRAYHDFLQRLEQMRTQYMSRLESLEMSHTQSLEDLEYDRQRRLEDILINAQQKREQLWIRYQRAVEDAHRRYAQALEKIDRGAARKRRNIWERYWESVYKIERNFQDAMYDAISQRSATRAIDAMRKRARGLEDAERSRDKDLRGLQENLREQEEEARIRRDRMLEDARRAYEQGLDDLERNLQDQIDALERSLERRKEKLIRHHEWKMEQLRNQYRLEYLEALQAYTGQEDLLSSHLQRMQQLWDNFRRGLNLPSVPGPPTGGGGRYSWAEGGADIFTSPTNITVGDSPGGIPELVVAMPMDGRSVPQWIGSSSSTVEHVVSGGGKYDFDVRAMGMGQGVDESMIEGVMMRVLREVWPDATVHRR